MIKLTDDQIAIMGKPNFSCAGPAKLLIASGVYEDKAKKAEYEQAVFIHWALEVHKEHGENWAEEGKKILVGLAKGIAAPPEQQTGSDS